MLLILFIDVAFLEIFSKQFRTPVNIQVFVSNFDALVSMRKFDIVCGQYFTE